MDNNEAEIIQRFRTYASSGIALPPTIQPAKSSSTSLNTTKYTRQRPPQTIEKNGGLAIALFVVDNALEVGGNFDRREVYKIPSGYEIVYKTINKTGIGIDDWLINLILRETNTDNYKFLVITEVTVLEKDIVLPFRTDDLYYFDRFQRTMFQHGVNSSIDISRPLVDIESRQAPVNLFGYQYILKRNGEYFFTLPSAANGVKVDWDFTPQFTYTLEQDNLITEITRVIPGFPSVVILTITDEKELTLPTYTIDFGLYPVQSSDDDITIGNYLYAKTSLRSAPGGDNDVYRIAVDQSAGTDFIPLIFPTGDTISIVPDSGGTAISSSTHGLITKFNTPPTSDKPVCDVFDYFLFPAYKNEILTVRDFLLSNSIEAFCVDVQKDIVVTEDPVFTSFANTDVPYNSVDISLPYSTEDSFAVTLQRNIQTVKITKSDSSITLNIENNSEYPVTNGIGTDFVNQSAQFLLAQDHGYPITGLITNIRTDSTGLLVIGDPFIITTYTDDEVFDIDVIVNDSYLSNITKDLLCIGDIEIFYRDYENLTETTIENCNYIDDSYSITNSEPFYEAVPQQIVTGTGIEDDTRVIGVATDYKTLTLNKKTIAAGINQSIVLQGAFTYKIQNRTYTRTDLFTPVDLYPENDPRNNSFVLDIGLGKPNLIGTTLYIITKINEGETAEGLAVNLSDVTPSFSTFETKFIVDSNFVDISVIE